MIVPASRAAATRAIAVNAARGNVQRQQQRGIIDYLTNYPDKVMEQKKLQMAGGTCQGDKNPTWLKQPGDAAVAWFGFGVLGFGMIQLFVGHYRLYTGKGKMD